MVAPETLPVEDGQLIMAHLAQAVVNAQCEPYWGPRREDGSLRRWRNHERLPRARLPIAKMAHVGANGLAKLREKGRLSANALLDSAPPLWVYTRSSKDAITGPAMDPTHALRPRQLSSP